METSKIRNFCIIAHIDHGKSTLADRFLEVTKTVEQRKMKEQLLDQMDLERERGITIKLQPVRMLYKDHELNLIDTPGHVDFSYEVSRSLAACEGAILVVDATQGIQAQTLANVNMAIASKLKLIPVVNKIDLPNADPEGVAQELVEALGFTADEIIFASAKTGENVEAILDTVIKLVPAPDGKDAEPLQALIFDSKYDKHRGVVVFLRIMNGNVRANETLRIMGSNVQTLALEVVYFRPEMEKNQAQTALPGYREIKPMVFASIFPTSGDEYPVLRDAMDKLKLSDASLSFEPEHVPALGFGFRTGFLGLLHMDIVRERLTREFDLELVLTAPSVAYVVEKTNGEKVTIYNPVNLPDPAETRVIAEPWVDLEIVSPEKYLGGIMTLITTRRGAHKETSYLGPGRLKLLFEVPLANIISDFYDKLKSISSGYASMNYTLLDYRQGDLVKVDILVAGERVDSLSFIIHQSVAVTDGRRIVDKLKELLPKQQFPVAVQAAIGGKIIARETIPALRKDVTAKLYGGDVTRKMKLLKKQKKGKKRLTQHGRVQIPQEAFLELMKRG